MNPIEVRGLVKEYGRRRVVDDVSFTIRSGRVTGLLGPNGAGKTTTLRVLLGLASETAGSALVFGDRYRSLADPLSVVGSLIDPSGIHPGRSGRDHLRVIAAAGHIASDRVDAVIGEVGMQDAASRRAATYSMGMKQRIALAAALLGRPRILILDEPGNGLDPAGMRWLRDFMRGFADDGGTVLLASHALSEVTQVADDAVIIARGQVVAEAPLDEIAESGTLEDAYLALTNTAEGIR